MKNNNVIQEKTFQFSIKIINLYKYLTLKQKEFVLSKQLLKSGTSIGANIEESIGGQSKNDFISKISISYKEARESLYRLKLLKETDYISNEIYNEIYKELEEILKILWKIQLTLKK